MTSLKRDSKTDPRPATLAPGTANPVQPLTPGPNGQHPAPLPATRPRTRLVARRWRGPGWRWLTVYSLVLILGLVGVLLAGIGGVREGLEQRAAIQATAVANHYQRGLAHAQAGESALALAEFEMVLRLRPDHLEARAAMLRVMATTATPQPTSPPAPTPTPPPVSTPYTLDVLLGEAQSLYDQKEWTQAAERLERIRATDAAYETDTVTNLLYKIYYNTGSDLVAAGRLEEGIRQIERALALRPDDKAALEQIQLATAYLQAMGYWQANWQKAVSAFAELYKQRPNYLDVEVRLANAAIAYGDAMAQRGAWCDAVTQYAIALQVRPSAALRATRDAANSQCSSQASTA
ncbi:MAG: tetratricopeptide repeat protein, partial [Anaerolineae bacterium]